MKKIYLIYVIILGISVSSFAQNTIPKSSQDSLYTKYMTLAQEQENRGDKKEATRFLNEAATLKWEEKKYTQAIELFKKSIKLNSDIGNESGIMMLHNNLGLIYADMRAYEQSLFYFKLTLNTRRKTKNKSLIISTLVNISVVTNNLARYQESVDALEEALGLAREMSDATQMRACYGMLAETYEKMGNQDRMLHYFNLYRTFHEVELKNKEGKYKETTEKALLEARIAETEKKYKELELEKKELELKQKEKTIKATNQKVNQLAGKYNKQELALQVLTKDSELKEQEFRLKELQNQAKQAEQKTQIAIEQKTRNILIASSIFLALLAGLVFYSYWDKRKTNKKLESQNEEILSQQTQIVASIKYASRIQNAMLSKAQLADVNLPEHFIFFRPRDIVSGDFYWFASKQDKIIMAAVDCTGHGVPGAFMSMVGDSLLSQIVHDKEILEADKILDEMSQGVNTILNQSTSENRDGMDVALIIIDQQKKEIQFAGAHSPFIYIQDEQIFEIKGDKFGIGGNMWRKKDVKRNFQKHIVKIDKPTTFYIFSDGYQDQFGGENNKKFMSKNLRKMLLEIHTEELEEQKERLAQRLDEWIQDCQQVDDILVIGGKIK